MVSQIGIVLGCSAIAAVLYRLGGVGKPFNTKIRDMGVPTVCLGLLLALGFSTPWYAHLLAWGLFFAALTTYWDKLFGYDNFYMHGFMCALAYLPFALMTGLWLGFILRCVVCGLAVGYWSRINGNHIVEESGRGFILCATIPLLFLGG